jgi:hypothetical protein
VKSIGICFSAAIGIVGGAVGIRQVWPIFIERLRRDLLPRDAIGALERQLKEYFRKRLTTMSGAQQIADSARLSFVSTQLMQHILSFVEGILKLKAANISFEISIFANVAEPEIICYYDSSGSEIPSSAGERAKDPQFYRKKNYEAVQLLDRPSPTYEIKVFSRPDERVYKFRNEEQKSRIKSTALCSFVTPEPLVLVLVADQSGFFDSHDAPLADLIHLALMSVAFEKSVCQVIKMPGWYSGLLQNAM